MISTADLQSIFRRIIDEFQTDYYTETEIDAFINDSQKHLFKRLTNPDTNPNRTPGFGGYFESSYKISEYLTPLTRRLSGSITQPAVLQDGVSNSILTRASLEAQAGRSIYGIKSLHVRMQQDGKYHPVKWKSHSEHTFQNDMVYYDPSVCDPHMVVLNNTYEIYPDTFYQGLPADTLPKMDYHLIALLIPLDVETGVQDSEFPEVLANIIAYRAAELASISTRDTEFVQTIRSQIEQIGV